MGNICKSDNQTKFIEQTQQIDNNNNINDKIIEQKIIGYEKFPDWMCPSTKGGKCSYINGKCKRCGRIKKDEEKVEEEEEENEKDNKLEEEKNFEEENNIEEEKVEGKVEEDKNIENDEYINKKFICPETNGLCNFTNGKKCKYCGKIKDPLDGDFDSDEDEDFDDDIEDSDDEEELQPLNDENKQEEEKEEKEEDEKDEKDEDEDEDEEYSYSDYSDSDSESDDENTLDTDSIYSDSDKENENENENENEENNENENINIGDNEVNEQTVESIENKEEIKVEKLEKKTQKQKKTWKSLTLDSSWNENLKGGYKNCLENPQFALNVNRSVNVSITISLKNQTPSQKRKAIFFFVTHRFKKNKRIKQISNNDIAYHSRYVICKKLNLKNVYLNSKIKNKKNDDNDSDCDSYIGSDDADNENENDNDNLWTLIVTKRELTHEEFTIKIRWWGFDNDLSIEELKKSNENNKMKEDGCEKILEKYERHFVDTMFFKKDPLPEIIEYCKNNNCKFLDTEFLPNENSIGINPPNKIDIFKRPDEFANNPRLYINGIECGDMKQGKLGNCWLCQAIASIANVPKRVTSIINPKKENNEFGCYSVKLYNEKTQQFGYVLIDDYFVTRFGKLRYGRSQDIDELFVPIIEKAMAKVFKKFSNLNGNTIGRGLLYLTGGKTFYQPFSKKQNIKTKEMVWNKIIQFSEKKWLMGLTSHKKGTKSGNFLNKKNGIVSMHAYSLLKGYEIKNDNNEVIKLCKIRNTWGYSEF